MRNPLLFLALVGAASLAFAEQVAIDWDKARALHQRASRGETLSPEELKYYEEAKRQHQAGNRPGDRAPQARNSAPPPEPPKGLVPLTDLKAKYRDQEGGLYGGGKNEPSAELAAHAREAAAWVQPLDNEGRPAAGGKIVLVSLGMSNTTQEFSAFKRLADTDPRKASNLMIVDCAQGGRTAQSWAKDDRVWEEAIRRIEAAGVKPEQVQVMWLKQANAGPSEGWPAAANKLRDDIRQDIEQAQKRFPNLRLIYLSSRIYAGYATTRLNPEPYAYETAFAVREVIQQQPKNGPVLLWGPYLWTDGENGRKLDGLRWSREDVGPDGTHPSESGRKKVAELLLGFLATDPYATPWFLKK